jgi:hyperosmotically inducible protein
MERTTMSAMFRQLLFGETTMRLSKRLTATFLALVLTSLIGCAGTARQESAGEYIDDTWITTRVKAALVGDEQVKATEVNVETFKGVVQLSGFVSSEAAMAQAVRVAQGVRGVTSVENSMLIK